jgi:hypothetical protein
MATAATKNTAQPTKTPDLTSSRLPARQFTKVAIEPISSPATALGTKITASTT